MRRALSDIALFGVYGICLAIVLWVAWVGVLQIYHEECADIRRRPAAELRDVPPELLDACAMIFPKGANHGY